MALEVHINSLVNNLTRSARAWRSISTEGGTRVSNVGSALITLLTHRTGLLSPAIPGALATVMEQATADLEWLRSCVGRLGRIEAGAQDALNTLRAKSNHGDKLTWSLRVHHWIDIVYSVAEAMRRDLADKRRVLNELERASRGCGIHADRIELYAALWLEQPHLREYIYELPNAVLEAEMEAQRVSKIHTTVVASPSSSNTTPRAKHHDSNLSPAMAMLLGGN